MGRDYQEVPVIFEDIRFEKPLHVPTEGNITTSLELIIGAIRSLSLD